MTWLLHKNCTAMFGIAKSTFFSSVGPVVWVVTCLANIFTDPATIIINTLFFAPYFCVRFQNIFYCSLNIQKHNFTGNWYILGLGDISHAILMCISSVKPVPWLAVNLHHLLSDGAAFNTQSRSSLTSYTISRSLSKAIHLRYYDDLWWLNAILHCSDLWSRYSLLTRCAWQSCSIYRPALIHTC